MNVTPDPATFPKGRRGRPSAQETDQRQTLLLQTARHMFVRGGYRGTTMDDIAAAAGLTKRTLYSWHRDKEALFTACVIAGAERFPTLDPDDKGDMPTTLRRYVIRLVSEMSATDSMGMGMLFLREASDFPELSAVIQNGFQSFLIAPLAQYLRKHGLEEADGTDRTTLFVAMAMAPVHNAMLTGAALPGEAATQAHAALCVGIFAGSPA